MKLTGSQYQQLQQALLSAFPSAQVLAQMVRFHLNENLAVIASGKNLSETVFRLVEWAEAKGRLEELITKAVEANPGNPALRAFVEQYQVLLESAEPPGHLPERIPNVYEARLDNSDRSMVAAQHSHSFQILIEGRQEGQAIDVLGLCRVWQAELGGTLAHVKQEQHLDVFSWQGTANGLAQIQDYDKHERLDQLIAPYGALRVLEITQNKECVYQYIPPMPSSPSVPGKDASNAEMKAVAQDIDLLVMTVTDTERTAFLPFLMPLPGQQAVLKGSITTTTYRFGQFGRYRIAHVESTMGSGGRQGATLTAGTAISELKPKALILLGIAFGVDRKKQRLGDVIVAEAVCNYDLQRVGAQETIFRGEQVQCGNILSERFRTRRDDWDLLQGAHRKVHVHQGLMLSGSKLVDNKDFRSDLVANFPTALGGEMEGAGAYAAAINAKIEVILVKAICDWADGHKHDRAQLFAAYAAVHLAHHVLSKPDVLDPLGARDVGLPGTAGAPPQSRSPPRILLNDTNILQLLGLAQEYPMNSDVDSYVNEHSFLATLTKHLRKLVGRIRRDVDTTPDSPKAIIINLADKVPEGYGLTARTMGNTREGESLAPLPFEKAIFLVPARRLSKNLHLLQQHQENWRYLRVDHPITQQSVDALTEMRQTVDLIDTLFDPVKERFDGCRKECDELRQASQSLEELFKNLPSPLAPREVSWEILDRMKGYCDSISYYVDCCGKCLAALAETNTLETS